MKSFMLSCLKIFLISFITSNVKSYDIEQANICEYLSGAAYCGKEKYKTMQLIGSASGFVYQDTLYDLKKVNLYSIKRNIKCIKLVR